MTEGLTTGVSIACLTYSACAYLCAVIIDRVEAADYASRSNAPRRAKPLALPRARNTLA